MEFMFDCARLPKNKQLLKKLNSAAIKLSNKLTSLDLKQLEISEYNKKHLEGKISNLSHQLQLNSYILAMALEKNIISLKKTVFIEYGGGIGMLSLLAKEIGIGIVIYNDIYDISCKDAENIAKAINLKADYYVNGDIDDVINFMITNSISCNAIASYDVIEHIYNVESFFEKLINLPHEQLNVVMASGANIFNPLKCKQEMRVQIDVEYNNRIRKKGHKDRDCLRAYSLVRAEIIYNYLNKINEKLSEDEINKLAECTRGMIKYDIENSVDEYIKTKIFPQVLKHPTNTCDPYTGNWAEHLMNPYELKNILLENGFDVDVLGGFYGKPLTLIKQYISKMLNIMINISGKHGLRFAPFYTIYGYRVSGK